MADHHLTPRGPAPDIDLRSMRARVQQRGDELRHQSLVRFRLSMAAAAAVLVAGGLYGALGATSSPSDSEFASNPPVSPTSAASPAGPAEGCGPFIDGAVPGDDVGLGIVLDLGPQDEHSAEATVTITNTGDGPVTVNHPAEGFDVVGVDHEGLQVTGGEPRTADANIIKLQEGETVEVPAYVHHRACGSERDPVSYVALVPFLRQADDTSGLARTN